LNDLGLERVAAGADLDRAPQIVAARLVLGRVGQTGG
jgi:hypothetical protein